YCPAGVVYGNSVFHVGLQPERWGSNLELTAITRAVHTARSYALARLVAEAETLGAVGVLGVRIEGRRYDWAEEMLEVVATGTAVGVIATATDARPGPAVARPGAPVWTTRLSPGEVAALGGNGYAPAAVVLGTCVYHVEHRSFRRQWLSDGRLREMPTFTQGLADGREIALARLRAHAEQVGADVVVGVAVAEDHHGWGDHAVEHCALGDGLHRTGAGAGGTGGGAGGTVDG
ncbi:MAG: heavy metal-binding domain-containing protein, partial [Actinomycetes bacterium]